MAAEELLTTKQVCEQYPVFQPGTLRYWRHSDQGPASFTIGPRGRVVYRRTEIERWLGEQEAMTRRGGDTVPAGPMQGTVGGRTTSPNSTVTRAPSAQRALAAEQTSSAAGRRPGHSD